MSNAFRLIEVGSLIHPATGGGGTFLNIPDDVDLFFLCASIELEVTNGAGGAAGVDWGPKAPEGIVNNITLTADHELLANFEPFHHRRFDTIFSGQGVPLELPAYDTAADAVNVASAVFCAFGFNPHRPYDVDLGMFLPGNMFDEVRLQAVWNDPSAVLTGDLTLVTLTEARLNVAAIYVDSAFNDRPYRGTPVCRFLSNPMSDAQNVFSFSPSSPVRWLGFAALDSAGLALEDAVQSAQGTYKGGHILFQGSGSMFNGATIFLSRFNLAIPLADPSLFYPAYMLHNFGPPVDLSRDFRLNLGPGGSGASSISSLLVETCEIKKIRRS